MIELLGGRRVVLYRRDQRSGSLVCVATAGAADARKWIGQVLPAGEGVAGRAVLDGRPICVSDLLADARLASPVWLRERCREEGLGTAIAAPLLAQGEAIGALVLADASARAFAAHERRMLVALSDLAALALENARLDEERLARLRAAEALLDIARATGSTLELKQVLKIVAMRAAQAVGAARCSINVWRDGHLVPVMSQFADGHQDLELWARFKAMGSYRMEEVPANATAIRTRRPVVIEDAATSDLIAPSWRDAWGVRAALVVPMIRQDEVVGTLNLDVTDGPHRWGQGQIDLAMTIASQAALAAENARLYEQVSGQLRELRHTQDQLFQASKLAAVGQLAAGVAHEVNNPLAVVVGQAQLLRLKTSDPGVLDKADKILKSAMRAAGVIKELQTFVQVRPSEQSSVDLAEVVDRALALREHALRTAGIQVFKEVVPDLPRVSGDAQQLEQAVVNLLVNAAQALATTGDREPRITLRLMAENGLVRLTVSDTGPGIDPEVLPRIFEPFFTTKAVGQGTGLGLSICYGLVAAHGGRIFARSELGEGATFVVELPARSDETAPEPRSTPSPDSDRRPRRILVIDDEEYVADTLRALFESLGQDVTMAIGGASATGRAHEAGSVL